MTNIDPGDYNIGDLVRVAFADKPLDALAKADIAPSEPAIEEQVRKPTDNEQAEIEKLATEAAELQDELKAATGDKGSRLKSLRNQLKEKMLQHGLTEVNINGRPPIELATSQSRKASRKSIVAVLEDAEAKKLTKEQQRDPKVLKKAKSEGKKKALNLWNTIPYTVSQSIKIPDPAPPEVDSPY